MEVRTHGDIAKSIRFGATMVMIGSLFAAHEESPGETVELDGKNIKNILVVPQNIKKVNIRTLKVKMFVEHKGSLKIPLLKWNKILQSSISYAGERT